jgi:hypothetical protein
MRPTSAISKLVWLALAALPAPAQPCRTPLGIPCYTIRLETSERQIFHPGRRNISHFTETATVAVRRDGSFVRFSAGQHLSVFLRGSTDTGPVSTLYLAPLDRVVAVDHWRHTASFRAPSVWQDRPWRRSADGDSECATGIRHFGGDFKRAGSSTVAGVPVVRWTRKIAQDGDQDVYLAPSLDCYPLKTYASIRNRWFLPIYTESVEAVQVKLGEPDPALFALPALSER